MLSVIEKWFNELLIKNQNSSTKKEIHITDVAFMFHSWNVFQDMTTAKNYIIKTLGHSSEFLVLDDLVSLFLKGILKEILRNIA
jgi:hypothetical protein